MKVISLSPPYGTLVSLGLKKIETRGWSTSYRGPLAIHQTAAPGPKGTTEAALWDRCLSEPFRSALASQGVMSPARLPRGKIVATCELLDCVPTWASWASVEPYFTATHGNEYWQVPPPEPERAFGDYRPGRFAWLLADIRAVDHPIPARGALGLWNYEGSLP